MKHSVIRATSGHIAPLAKLFDAYRQFYGQSSDLDSATAFLSDRLQNEQSVIFLALSDDVECGFTQLYPSYSSVAMRSIWILNDLFVTPQTRRQGVAKSLMQAAAEFAAERGARRLALATAVNNHSAQSLYESLGWVRNESFLHYNLEL